MSSTNNKSQKKISTYQVALVGMMAAFVYVGTNFRIEIPMAIGKTMVHFGNVFCILSGVLLGPFSGGMAGAIGSGFFDLTGGWASSAPYTFFSKFFIGWVAGMVAHSGGYHGEKTTRNVIGGIGGIVTYLILYIGKSFVSGYFLLHNPLETVLMDCGQKFLISMVSGTMAVIVSSLLAPVFLTAMKRAGLYNKLYGSKSKDVAPCSAD